MSPAINYFTGEEIHAGDRVQFKGNFGRVVFVSDGAEEEFEAGFGEYTGTERGVMVCDDDGETSFVGEPDEMLMFVDRA